MCYPNGIVGRLGVEVSEIASQFNFMAKHQRTEADPAFNADRSRVPALAEINRASSSMLLAASAISPTLYG